LAIVQIAVGVRLISENAAMVQATSTFSISHIDDGNGASANSR